MFLADHTDALNPPMLGGVYKFETDTGIAYIGKSVNLRSRIKSHLNGSVKSKLSPLIEDITKVSYSTMSDADMHIMEFYLISKYRPYLNTEAVPMNKSSIVLPDPEWKDILDWQGMAL